MTSNGQRLVVEPNVPPPAPPRRPRWHNRWGLVFAFQTGMIGVLVVRHVWPDPAESQAPVTMEPTTAAQPTEPARAVPAAAPAATTPTPPPTPRPARSARIARTDRITEVEITSEPAGATVYIGGQIGGTTPLAAFLAPSPTTIRFELDGHDPTTLRWSPRVGRRVTARLKPTP